MNIEKIFERNVPGTRKVLREATIAIAGCGGLGSNAAVSCVRAGIGRLILVDPDRVEASNLNRQHFFQSDIGRAKVDALSEYLKAINPEVHLVTFNKELKPDDVSVDFEDADILIEAFDRAESKSWLIESWCTAFPKRPVVCASGLSGFGRTDELTIKNSGNIYIIGDGKTDMSMGLCSARVAIAANMQVNVAIELLMNNRVSKSADN